MKKLWILSMAGCLAVAMMTAGCGGGQSPESESAAVGVVGSIKAVATVGMIADVVQRVGGEQVDVEGLIGEGVDPHAYKPTRADVVALSEADIVFYNGLMLEGKMGDVLVRSARSGKPVYAVTEAILEQGDYVISDEDAYYDPHVWMDVQGWIMAVAVVKDALVAFDPDHADSYERRAAEYVAQLEALDEYARTVIGSIPENRRVLVTAHDAFNYLGRAYGLEVRGIQGLSTESEAGIQDIERLIEFLDERDIPAVFVETSVADKNVRALVEGAAARGHEVTIGGELFSDAMGPTGTYEGTYVGMIDHNVTTIANALGGEAVAGGMQGKLNHGE